ncbi:glycoside hydrolase family 78 protein [Amylocarpus encephaloides]|uniref:Glycoside hydrolase family 78 protein n=1 Tax=Amylocarpus encephaloides TaxID=45428 RepID=A0A9P7YAC8_9HELO|nr:glycoside hydrolase family 78 protein [Amylocarpus encephaloides]
MFFKGFLVVQTLIILFYKIHPTTATPPILRAQAQLSNLPADDWQKYVRAPASTMISPVRIVSSYTTGDVKNPEGFLAGKGTTLIRRQAAAGNTTAAGKPILDIQPQIVVDFGQNTAGFLSIKFGGSSSFNSTPGLPGLRLAFSETLQYLTNVSDFSRSNNGDSITPGSDQVRDIAVKPEPYTWTDDHGCEYDQKKVCVDGLHGFRYMKIYMDALSVDAPYTTPYGSVTFNSISLNYSGYHGTPDTFSGWIQTSDDNLNQWWFDAVYTNDMCTDIFRINDTEPRGAASPTLLGKVVLHDGAKRDRDPYVGDVAVAGKTSYLSHNIPLAARNVLADLADHQRADGWIPPASILDYTLHLMDYPLWWVVCSYNHYMYTGDIGYMQQYYSNMVKVLDTYYTSITNPNTNLIQKGLGSSGGYGDYAFLDRTGSVTYYNALYVLALQHAASIAQSLGNHVSDATRWTDRANLVSQAIRDRLFDNSVGAFFDGTCGFEPCPVHAQDGNSISILSGVANSTQAQAALDYMSRVMARPYGNAFYDNDGVGQGLSQRVYAFISYFEIQSRFQVGSPASALEEIRRLYGWMATHDPQVTAWEGIGVNGSLYQGPYSSQAHGWATGIVPLLSNNVLGVTPTGPGFSTWSIKPIPGDVKWAKGVVPGPNGSIKVSWNRDADQGLFWLSVSAPQGSSGIISVPVESSTKQVYLNSQLVSDGHMTKSDASDSEGYMTLSVGGGDNTVTVGYSI